MLSYNIPTLCLFPQKDHSKDLISSIEIHMEKFKLEISGKIETQKYRPENLEAGKITVIILCYIEFPWYSLI